MTKRKGNSDRDASLDDLRNHFRPQPSSERIAARRRAADRASGRMAADKRIELFQARFKASHDTENQRSKERLFAAMTATFPPRGYALLMETEHNGQTRYDWLNRSNGVWNSTAASNDPRRGNFYVISADVVTELLDAAQRAYPNAKITAFHLDGLDPGSGLPSAFGK